MSLTLENGSRVGVIGGGPAGSLFSYFLLNLARHTDLSISVDIYEPRDFTKPGPIGCNMCGGIVSESLIQALAGEGISLPPAVVQRGIDSYVLHTADAAIRIDTPMREKRIAAVHRGGGPRDAKELKWGGLDGHLQSLARGAGANIVPTRIAEVGWKDGRPEVKLRDAAETYDLLVGACGVNSSGWQLFEHLGIKGTRPGTAKAYITELNLGPEAISHYFGSSMHTYLLDIPHLDFAAIIPKGDFCTVCLIGKEIDDDLINTFFNSEAVRRSFPEDFEPKEGACHCSPRMNVREASQPFMDRVVLIGDCGVSRLYKDGIGAAYRTAKAAALTAAFRGVSKEDFRKDYWPTYKSIAADNRFGWLIFEVVHRIKSIKLFLKGVVGMTVGEQASEKSAKRMSIVLWDLFTGSAAYRDVFFLTLDPRFIGRFLWATALSLGGRKIAKRGSGGASKKAGDVVTGIDSSSGEETRSFRPE